MQQSPGALLHWVRLARKNHRPRWREDSGLATGGSPENEQIRAVCQHTTILVTESQMVVRSLAIVRIAPSNRASWRRVNSRGTASLLGFSRASGSAVNVIRPIKLSLINQIMSIIAKYG